MPTVSMEQPVKVATPLVAAVGVQVSVPGPPVAGVAAVIERVDRRGVVRHRVVPSVFDRDCRRGGNGAPGRGIARLSR